jgi:hypothetical protein
VEMLIELMESRSEQIQRQACKALANLGVNRESGHAHSRDGLGIRRSFHPAADATAAPPLCLSPVVSHLRSRACVNCCHPWLSVANKEKIAQAGGIPPLVGLASSKNLGVCVEAVAALANLAVNGTRRSPGVIHLSRAGWIHQS